MRLRQVVWVSGDLEMVVNELCTRLGIEVCYRDPGVAHFGLQNALMSVGGSFIEVVSPTQEGTTAGRYLEKRGGDGGYMLLIQVDDLEFERKRLNELGVRVVWEGQGQNIRGMHLHPGDVGGAIVSFDVATPEDSWGWAGLEWPNHVKTQIVSGIGGVEMQSDDPAKLATRWGQVLGRRVDETINGDHVINLEEGGTIRFIRASDGRGEGIGGYQLIATDRAWVGTGLDIAGVRVRFI